jgi:hypothetical protein
VLKRAGLWRESDAAVLDQLYALADQPGAWMLIPVFFGHGRV